jgi:hypothetical protein
VSEDNEQQETTIHEQPEVKELIEKINYIRQWLDLAPDFGLLVNAFVIKTILDQKGVMPKAAELQKIEQWVENFYKSMSTLMGVFENNVIADFSGEETEPKVTLTEQGTKWVQEQMELRQNEEEN